MHVVQNIAPLDTRGAKNCHFGYTWCTILPLWIHVVHNITRLDTRDAQYCLFGYTWCKILPLWIYVVQSVAPVIQVVQKNYAGKFKLHDEQIAGSSSQHDRYVQTVAKCYVVCSNITLTVRRHWRI